ncbi:zinc ribbon domain-containing protein [Myxococcota bacterium]|nr:zinc ribbon domain-containing protein [Myxococcota bacterium]MBU1381190.1 zinc ribbon domain-containing protein [Myxococcota bacterium]MBU1496211.1 zinc ribbon domain-containing protein [Myxococcota bacterium]
MKCPNCGTEIVHDSIFCMECGYKIFEALHGGTVPVQTPPAASPPPVEGHTVYCPMCGLDNKSTESHCRMCGSSLHLEETIQCERCGSMVNSKNSFCPGCGGRLSSGRIPTPPGGLPAVTAQPASPPVAQKSVSPNVTAPPPPERRVQVAGVPVDAPKPVSEETIYPHQARQGQSPLRQIKVISGGRVGEKYDFSDNFTIGRTSGDLKIPGDESLDIRHVIINATSRGIKIRDPGTVNGIYIKLAGMTEIFDMKYFYVGPLLFIYENINPREWSLNSIWERGTRLVGTTRSMSPWGRLRMISPVGITAGIYLLWNDSEMIGNCFVPPPDGNDHICRISHRRNQVFLESIEGDIYVKIDDEIDLTLPVQFRAGGQVFEISG